MRELTTTRDANSPSPSSRSAVLSCPSRLPCARFAPPIILPPYFVSPFTLSLSLFLSFFLFLFLSVCIPCTHPLSSLSLYSPLLASRSTQSKRTTHFQPRSPASPSTQCVVLLSASAVAPCARR